jgi:hypothetical protein
MLMSSDNKTSGPKKPLKAIALKDRTLLIGYARVSTQDQNLELQIEALTRAGCKKIFEDKISGSRAERSGLAKAQESLREGDTLVVWKLDRLGRSVKHLVDLIGELHKQGVQFRSLTDAIDTGTASGRSSSTSWPAWRRWNGNLPSNGPAQGGRKRQMTDSKIKSAKKLLASGVPPRRRS